MKKQFLLTFIAALLMVSSTFSQQINLVNPTMTPVQAVEDVLLGAGINAFNITYNASAVNANTAQQSVRQFNNGTSNFPISHGVLLNTNSAPSVTDADLQAITTIILTMEVLFGFNLLL